VPNQELSTSDWAILAVLCEAPAHGFHLSQFFARGAELGFIWTIQRPQVYRGLEHLGAHGFITPLREEESEAGPKRTVFKVTTTGRRALTTWLSQPVERIRKGRSEFLLKLVFLKRRKLNSKRLLRLQREQFKEVQKLYEKQLTTAKDTEMIVLQWRLENVRAALRFIEQQLKTTP
jgi:DNA-binding PadR family transcriptional regulator